MTTKPTNSQSTASEAVERTRPAIERISREVWAMPEVAHAEMRSAAVHMRELEAAGFRVSRGTCGMPTAFVAEWSHGSGGAKIGFLPEYDALPGLANRAEPRPGATDANGPGHACGHNLLGAGLTGAAIALKTVLHEQNLPGTIRVYGCAAEEDEGAKIYMAREGLFDDLDACLAWHPFPEAGLGVRTAALMDSKVEFFGAAAHAGATPWKGRSALHAMELFAHGLNLMREHLEPTARIHYIFEKAGTASNVVTSHTRMQLRIRDLDLARVGASVAWAKSLAEGCAMGTQTRATFTTYCGYADMLNNTPLLDLVQAHMEAVGVPRWTPVEEAFAREAQKSAGLPEEGLCRAVTAFTGEDFTGGSSDVGDVSWCCPTVTFHYPTMPLGIALHTWPVTAASGHSMGLNGAMAATHILARAALDIATDAELRKAARAEFDRRRAGRLYASPLPPDRKLPLALEMKMAAG